MELVQISYSNELFLFFNRISKTFGVFKMEAEQNNKNNIKTAFLEQSLSTLKEDMKTTFKFKHQYTLDFINSNMYKYVLGEDIKSK